ncbi:MAG: ABC transporter substrate-binding protein [Actinobacteria bacterium]|nr:ABC transporter substrate-binding protein [Actinomycetota bacterium]
MTACERTVNSSTASDNTPQKLTIYRSRLLVGSDATYPPFEYIENGKTVGFDIDIAAEIAERLEKELEIIPITWDIIYDIPEDIKIDMAISAVERTEDKEKLADFSDPYYIEEYMMIALSETKPKLREDLKGKKIGMLEDRPKYFSAEYLEDFTIETYSDIILMFEALKSKDIEGILVSVPLGKSVIEGNNGFFSIIEIVKSEMEYNIVFLKGSPLKDEINRILEEMKQDGTYQVIYDKWFAMSK